MIFRPNQFGVRENTASPRQHASRRAVNTPVNIAHLAESLEAQPTSSRYARSVKDSEQRLYATSQDEATNRDARDGRHLLDVHEVAELLHAPVSWVYGRMRKRSLERLPGYRLGKYWRFRKDEVLAWVDSHCGGSHAA
jgi:excisionase family DNA binding protein